MKNTNIFVVTALIVAAVAVFWVTGNVSAPDSATDNPLGGEEAVVYKDPTCGCCEVYVSYLRKEGIKVTANQVADINEVKQTFGIPGHLQSCHTMEVGGYIVEGHVPLAAVEKLLAERPDIEGISLPGMPSGSPGMPGPKTAPFIIYTLGGAEGEIYTTI